MKMKLQTIAIISLCLLTSCSGRKGNTSGIAASTESTQSQDKELIPIPKAPGMLADDQKKLFILGHYWEGLDWKDTTLIGSDALDKAFEKWMQSILWIPQADAATVTGSIVSCGHGYPDMQTALYRMIAEVLNDPNSEVRNDELFLPVLEAYTTDTIIPEADRMRPAFLLKQLGMNRLGTIASDFTISLLKGGTATLDKLSVTPFTILYFFNPDCPGCEDISEVLKTDPELQKLEDRDFVRIVAVYPDPDPEPWDAHKNDVYPYGWIPGRLANEAERDKYYLQAIPTLYLLDKDRRIILKDASVETVIGMLTSRAGDAD